MNYLVIIGFQVMFLFSLTLFDKYLYQTTHSFHLDPRFLSIFGTDSQIKDFPPQLLLHLLRHFRLRGHVQVHPNQLHTEKLLPIARDERQPSKTLDLHNVNEQRFNANPNMASSVLKVCQNVPPSMVYPALLAFKSSQAIICLRK